MNNPTVWVIAVVFLIGWISVTCYAAIRKIINIKRTPSSWISALPESGKVEVTGTAGEKTSVSPIRKSPCVVWKMKIEEMHRDGKGRTSWSTVVSERSERLFEVRDETGVVQVNPWKADLALQERICIDTLGDEQYALLSAHSVNRTNFFGGEKTFRASEGFIAPGEEVFVNGAIAVNDGTKVIEAVNGTPLLISDRNERGVLADLYKDIGVHVLFGLIFAAGGVYLLARVIH